MSNPDWLNDEVDEMAFEYRKTPTPMVRFTRAFVATGAFGVLFGIVVGIMYGVTTGNWPGALGMFFGMIGMAYFGAVVIGAVFFFDEWINR